jgi:hypothetical protein
MTSIHRVLIALLAFSGLYTASEPIAAAASAGAAAASQPIASAGASPAAASVAPKVQADLRQLMRGILFPSSNVVFAAQQDLDRFPKAEDPSVSPNPITSTYGGWDAVQNAALAIAEATNLMMLPGRMCSSHHAVPVQRADWQKYVRGLRAAANVAYKAAVTKSTDAMLDASDTLTQACQSCHDVYRDKEKKGGDKNRCLP